MSSIDWQEVQRRLESFYTPVDLNCDGYRVTLRLERISTYKNVITLYVDGWIRGEWLLNDCEERRRFLRPKTTRLYRKVDFKLLSKAELKRVGIDPDKTLTVYSFTWNSIGALIRHLKANNQEITLIKAAETEAA